MFNGEIFFVIGCSAFGMGPVDEIMVYPSFGYENNEGGSEGYLWCIRNTSSRKYNYDCNEVEKVIVNQGCDRLWFKDLIYIWK